MRICWLLTEPPQKEEAFGAGGCLAVLFCSDSSMEAVYALLPPFERATKREEAQQAEAAPGVYEFLLWRDVQRGMLLKLLMFLAA